MAASGHRQHHHTGGPGHDRAPDGADNIRRIRLALVLTWGFMAVELAGGLFANSLALLADAGHMLADGTALALAWLGFRLSERPTDARRSYGYARAQVLAAFTNGLVLAGVAVWIVIEAVSRIQTPAEVKPLPMLAVALAGLAINGVVFRILHRGDRHNLNLRAALYHVIGDILGSAAAVVAALIIMATGWMIADPLLSLLVAGLVAWGAIDVIRRTSHILLEGVPESAGIGEIRDRLMTELPELDDVHHIHVWSLTERQPLVTLHARLKPGGDVDRTLRRVKEVLRRDFHASHVTVQVEFGSCPD